MTYDGCVDGAHAHDGEDVDPDWDVSDALQRRRRPERRHAHVHRLKQKLSVTSKEST